MASTELTLTGALQQIAGDTTGMTATAAAQYIAAAVAAVGTSPFIYQGDYDADTNTPDLDTSPSAAIQQGAIYVVTVGGTFFTATVEAGDFLIAKQDAPTTEAHWGIVNTNVDQNVNSGSSPTFDGANITGVDAANVDLADTGELFTATDVEAAFAEAKALVDANVTKLATVETNADVTDATNVDAAGAVMESDTSTASMSFVLDEDDMSSDSATALATQQSIKAYVDSSVDEVRTLATKTGAYTLTTADHIIVATSGTWTATLPAASGLTGREFIIKNAGSGVITVDGNASETIDGATTVALNQWDSITIVCDGSNWVIV